MWDFFPRCSCKQPVLSLCVSLGWFLTAIAQSCAVICKCNIINTSNLVKCCSVGGCFDPCTHNTLFRLWALIMVVRWHCVSKKWCRSDRNVSVWNVSDWSLPGRGNKWQTAIIVCVCVCVCVPVSCSYGNCCNISRSKVKHLNIQIQFQNNLQALLCIECCLLTWSVLEQRANASRWEAEKDTAFSQNSGI